jgi:hypothetical protein
MKVFKPLFLIIVLIDCILVSHQVHAQVYIQISGIEGADSNCVRLVRTLQAKNETKVISAKKDYTSGIYQIVSQYKGTASKLWNNLTADIRQPFKLKSINDEVISLNYQGEGIDKPMLIDKKTATAANLKKKGCFECDYFPLCKYDVTKSYGGKEFRGIRHEDNSIEYYYCEDGVLTKRWEYSSKITRQEFIQGTWDDYVRTYEDYVNKTASMVILKSNVPIGTTWAGQISEEGSQYVFTMNAKGIKVNHNGNTNNDVIKVKAQAKGNPDADYFYYANGVGYIGKNLLEPVELGTGEKRIACQNWCGFWKQTEMNGRKIPADSIILYLRIETDGDGVFFNVRKKADEKLYIVREPTPADWSVWKEQSDTLIYLKNRFWNNKGFAFGKNSIPQKILYFNGFTFEYLGNDERKMQFTRGY